MRASKRLGRAAVLSVVAAFAVGTLAPAPVVGHGYFQAKNLNDCLGYERSDLDLEGTDLPFGGVRLYRDDDLRGRSITYCLTVHENGTNHCCEASESIRLPRWMRRDVESMRLAAAPGCTAHFGLYANGWKRFIVAGRLFAPSDSSEPKKARRPIRKEDDNQATTIDALLRCWDI